MSDHPISADSHGAEPARLHARIAELEHRLAAETRAREVAEAASEAKSELLATVSHEVRTPMGAIISMADLLLNTGLDETQRHYAETLRHSGRGLLAILNDILDYSKLAAGRFALAETAFDFGGLIRAAGAGLAARAHEKDLGCGVEVAQACAAHVSGDPARIRQVVDNLIDNALKFTETGSVQIRARCRMEGAHALLRVEVCDTGIGLTDAQKDRLFLPYAQGDANIAVKYGGTGLGLSIARQLVELMGGEMGCESVHGKGSVFWFTLRLPPAGSGEAIPEAVEQAGAADAPLSGHVLVVEDNKVNQMLIMAFLDTFGLSYDVAATGRAALERLSARSYDLVLMDIMMPEMDGVQTARRIRGLDGPVARVPVIALTANAMSGDREAYLAAGMDGYVAKPVGVSELFAALAPWLGPDEKRAATA